MNLMLNEFIVDKKRQQNEVSKVVLLSSLLLIREPQSIS